MKWFHDTGELKEEIPKDCVEACSHGGQCDSDIEYWQKKLTFDVPREKAIDWLLEYGAWSKEELKALPDVELAHKVLWLACNDIMEQDEWLGLIN